MDRLRGPFAYQVNNTTRRWEYPWAFEQIRPRPGLRVLEIGGGLSGLQFVLSRCGCDVTNVDPGVDSYGRDWGLDQGRFNELNDAFGTNVRLVKARLEDADLEYGSFDVVLSISVIEHMGIEVASRTISQAATLTRPGGRIVLTLDLFPDLQPFGAAVQNEFGTNVPVSEIIGDLDVLTGRRNELLGFPEFEPRRILERKREFLVGVTPAWVQCLVLRAPAG